jgi:molybdopterin synthase catalytic subunit
MRESIRLLEIRESVLRIDEVVAAVADPQAGGTTVFLGTVRSEDHERSVEGIDYSAHPTAMNVLQEVADEIARKYPVCRLAAVHRLGHLEVGDIAVIVAASCPHRGEAFAAARELIDQLKARTPIWKHQLFVGGGDEWVGTP